MTNSIKAKKLLSVVLSFVLVAAMALTMTACNTDGKKNEEASQTEIYSQNESISSKENATTFSFTVTDDKGINTNFNVEIGNAKTVGEALKNAKLIDGEQGAYGLYVKSVNGLSADYEKDGAYWSFCINGEPAATGVDTTEIIIGNTYSFVYTKA